MLNQLREFGCIAVAWDVDSDTILSDRQIPKTDTQNLFWFKPCLAQTHITHHAPSAKQLKPFAMVASGAAIINGTFAARVAIAGAIAQIRKGVSR